jgi:hypothetical protein
MLIHQMYCWDTYSRHEARAGESVTGLMVVRPLIRSLGQLGPGRNGARSGVSAVDE